MNFYHLLFTFFWGAIAAAGFAILFNVPTRTLLLIALAGSIGVVTRNLLMLYTPILGFASFGGAICIGIWAALWSHQVNTPGHVISIPGMIPMIPGVLAYRTMMGIWKYIHVSQIDQQLALTETVNFGLQTTITLVGISLGITIPNVIDRYYTDRTSFMRNIRT